MNSGTRHRDTATYSNDDPSGAGPPSAIGRVAGLGEDPLSWALTLVTWRGVRIGVHAIFPIWALAEVAAALPSGIGSIADVATGVICYAMVVLARELSRAWWAARAGREVHEIVIWPLGGLTPYRVAGLQGGAGGELGGLMFTSVLMFPLAGFLWALGAGGMELVRGVMTPARFLALAKDPIECVAFWMFHACVVLTAFHALAPMAPFDVSRAIDRRMSGRGLPMDAAGSSLRRGMLVAFALFTGGAVAGQERLMAVAALGALATWIEYRRVVFLCFPLPLAPGREERPTAWETPVAEDSKADGVCMDEAGRLDEVLAKITRSGLASLSREERRTLEAATRRSRGEGGSTNEGWRVAS